jgi:glycosyltransferase involved in cell wall biosynthesis
MKLFAALGPGDIVAAHRAQICGKAITSETSIIYSGQLFEYCREQGIETLALSYNNNIDCLHDGLLHLENQPRRFEKSGGIRFHLSRIAYALYLAVRARRFGADLAIIDSGSTHCFALAVFRLLGIPVAIDFHVTLWPNGFEPKRPLAQLIRVLNAWFFRRVAVGAVGVSPECGQFRSEGFKSGLREHDRNLFRVIFVGRAERNKGVFDVAAMAQRLRSQSGIKIVFEVCGDGDALPQLRQTVEEKRLEDLVRIHGQLARPELLQVYARAHAVIVPTRSDFSEGLPKVCAEAVLSGLPIITSRLSNVIPLLEPALLEAVPDDVDSYVKAITKLANDSALYERLNAACRELARQFLDRSQSYPAAIDRLIACLFPGWKLLDSYEPLFDRIC